MSVVRPESCSSGSPHPSDKCFSGAQGGTPTLPSIMSGVGEKPFLLVSTVTRSHYNGESSYQEMKSE